MKLFTCQHCGQLVYFENDHCESCARRLGFLPGQMMLSALEADGDAWRALAGDDGARYRDCANAQFGACNWLVRADGPEIFCAACRHNQVIPDISLPENLPRWQQLERAKHRLFYSLLRLRLPLANRIDDPDHGLAFEFLAVAPDTPKVMTGHDNGLITLALKEADDAERERMKQLMGESYRTLLGHFRHEVGHYFWDVLVRDGGKLDACRAVFGDDSQDYDEALKRNYEQGPPPDWRQHFISAYASCHPWEDFAETWAHYLHIVDTLEMGTAFGLKIEPPIVEGDALDTALDFDPYGPGDIQRLVDAWLPLVFAVNSLNRSMGQPDLYPFVLTPQVVGKLGFIHQLVHG
ncbi:MAG TPA: putative zinc-binding peptidase [Aliidongia sp.]|uniref:zinc-binding metallopeptidase family protein n=1 Tax=Aliidongia sp. TaxID=1914230 RepID=UPI002DDDB60F|nr:putative zinc-binding peptidase [Aliidongia sp.]HEV2678357.1 putative zinc-binding peptidase [Aliidongia sp.]